MSYRGDHTVRQQRAGFEGLESRTLFASVVPLSLGTASSALGNVLTINGTGGDDRIHVTNTTSGLVISNATGWSTMYTGALAVIRIFGHAGNDRIEIDSNIRTQSVLYGGAGIDTLVGGSGDDRLYGGDGRDYLYGRAGNDVLVTLGDSAVDRCYGGTGVDSFWCDTGADELVIDSSADEIAAGSLHRVASFMNLTVNGVTYTTPRTLLGQKIVDPLLASYATGYRNFSNQPLFSKYGPRPDDIYQGALGDCYLLASLGSVAKANPQVIRDSVVDLGDGTYAVQFNSGSSKVYVRVDADLPTTSGGSLAYASFGRQGSLWAAIIEKAYAFFRSGAGAYGSIESGFMADVYQHLGLSNSSTFSARSATELLQSLQRDLAAGRAVTFGTRLDVGSAPVTAGHAYMVDAVLTDSAGRVTGLRLRNPWGIDDFPGHSANDGYITLTASQALQAFWFACSARVR